MIISASEKVPLEKCPALVLNADFRPLSYYPLSLWCWQDAVKSVFLNRVSIVSSYQRKVRSPSFEMSLPSVIALKSFVKPSEYPNFTRFNVFLRDKFACQYCDSKQDLTFDHLLPKSKGGITDWENVVTACSTCNVKKGGKLYNKCDLKLKRKDKIKCLIGYSGKILNLNHLSKNIYSRPEIYLMHGDLDNVVPLSNLLEAKEFFSKQNYKINTKILKNCEHRIPTEGLSIGLNFLKKNFM